MGGKADEGIILDILVSIFLCLFIVKPHLFIGYSWQRAQSRPSS